MTRAPISKADRSKRISVPIGANRKRGVRHCCMPAFAAFLLTLSASSPEARAAMIGTMSFDYTLNLSFTANEPSPDNTGAIDFLSPRILYSSNAESVVAHSGPHGGVGLESGTYRLVYPVPSFPLPNPSSTPVGGFFAYYSFTEFMGGPREGAFVGLSPLAPPSGSFDELFEPHGVTEDQFLSVLKTGDVSDTMNMFLAMSESGLMPVWSYNAGSNSWSIAMDIYAFSDPQFAGTVAGGVVATPAATVPEGSSTLLLAGMGLISVLAAASLAKVSRPPSQPALS